MFQESRQRAYAKQEFGLKVPANPASVVVIGRRNDIEPEDLYTFGLAQGFPLVTIQPYDEIVAALQLVYSQHYGRVDGVPGATFAMVVSVDEPTDPRRTYVFDTQSDASPCRWSLFVQNQHLCFEVIDREGGEHSVNLKAGRDFEFGRFMGLSCEIGATSRLFVMNVRIGNRLVGQLTRPEGIPMDALNISRHMMFGMTVGGAPFDVLPAAGRFCEQAISGQVMTFRERLLFNGSRQSFVDQAESNAYLIAPGPDGWPDATLDMKYAPQLHLPQISDATS